MRGRIPTVSIVVPVYNVEGYLRKCLDSIVMQTYRDFEVLLVDDGSVDSSGIICDEYVAIYEYMHVYHQKNEGVVCARDVGIKHAKGKYLSFVDADDWIEPCFLRILVENMENYKADIVITGHYKDIKDKSQKRLNNIGPGIYEKKKLVPFFEKMLHNWGFYEFGIQPFLFNKIFNREAFIECTSEIDFQIHEAEDVVMIFPYLLHSKRIIVTEDCLYHYVYRENSATNKRIFNFYENICRMFICLDRKFQETEYYDIMFPQLKQYMRMLIYYENPTAFIAAEKRLFPFRKVKKDSDIILYGAGYLGKTYYNQLKVSKYCQVIAWVDAAYYKQELMQLGVERTSIIQDRRYDCIVIAIEDRRIISEVSNMLLKLGASEDKIIFEEPMYD